jgi:hypothetical protein
MIRMYDEGLEIEQMQPMRTDVYPLSHADVYQAPSSGTTSGIDGALEFATAADEEFATAADEEFATAADEEFATAADEAGRDADGQFTSL